MLRVTNSRYQNRNVRRRRWTAGTRSTSARNSARVAPVAARHEPVARALEDGRVRRLLGHGRQELDRAGAGADHRDPLAAQVVAVVPLGGVEAVALEAARQARDGGLVELARRHDHGVGRALPAARLDPPVPRRVVPAARADVRAGLDDVLEALLGDDLAQVGEDVGLGRAQPHPVAALGERERVEVARDVARGARIGVVEPGAAEPVGLLEDRDVRDAVAAQLDRRGDPAEAGSDDDHAGHQSTYTVSPICQREKTPCAAQSGIRAHPWLAW